jgi:hypothetical protein
MGSTFGSLAKGAATRLYPELYGAIGADAAATAISEVFQETRTVDRVRDAHTWVAFATVAELHLLDLTGNWPTRAGASIRFLIPPFLACLRTHAHSWVAS